MKECIKLEYAIAPIISRQQEYGIEFDVGGANELLIQLESKKLELKNKLQEVFSIRIINRGEFTPKNNYSCNRGGVVHRMVKGGTFTRIEYEEYNPNSRQQTVDRLCKEFGWTPQEFTDKGNPEFDEEIIESLPYKEMAPLKDYYIVNKRISQLSGGKQAWLKHVREDGRIYGSVMQSGTITARMAHYGPNLAQVPSCDKAWGTECRRLFRAKKGKIQVGCDADGLEARTLSGFLVPFDGGQFRDILLTGKKENKTDIHSINAIAYEVNEYSTGRDCAKTLFYAGIYGCKGPKAGLILQQFGIDLKSYIPNYNIEMIKIKQWNARVKAGFSDRFLECLVAGKLAQGRYNEKLPALPNLIQDVIKSWESNKFLKALDGRKLYPSNAHSCFNILNQSAGAIIMKKALAIADNLLYTNKNTRGKYEFMLNIHDEWQLEVENDKDLVTEVSDILKNSIKFAGEYFNFPCPMVGSIKIGTNWAETH
ncbi:MAG TPA: DNA polymerase [Nitrososphaeraceae archaeon]